MNLLAQWTAFVLHLFQFLQCVSRQQSKPNLDLLKTDLSILSVHVCWTYLVLQNGSTDSWHDLLMWSWWFRSVWIDTELKITIIGWVKNINETVLQKHMKLRLLQETNSDLNMELRSWCKSINLHLLHLSMLPWHWISLAIFLAILTCWLWLTLWKCCLRRVLRILRSHRVHWWKLSNAQVALWASNASCEHKKNNMCQCVRVHGMVCHYVFICACIQNSVCACVCVCVCVCMYLSGGGGVNLCVCVCVCVCVWNSGSVLSPVVWPSVTD